MNSLVETMGYSLQWPQFRLDEEDISGNHRHVDSASTSTVVASGLVFYLICFLDILLLVKLMRTSNLDMAWKPLVSQTSDS